MLSVILDVLFFRSQICPTSRLNFHILKKVLETRHFNLCFHQWNLHVWKENNLFSILTNGCLFSLNCKAVRGWNRCVTENSAHFSSQSHLYGQALTSCMCPLFWVRHPIPHAAWLPDEPDTGQSSSRHGSQPSPRHPSPLPGHISLAHWNFPGTQDGHENFPVIIVGLV